MTTPTHPQIDPSRAALLVMDYQNGVIEMTDDGDELVAIAGNLIRTFREHGGTIAYVHVALTAEDFDNIPAGSGMAGRITPERRSFLDINDSSSQIHDALAPQPDDIVVRKVRIGAFSTTDLHEQLQARNINTVILAGISTSGVVHSTLHDAHDRDYRVIVLADACGDRDADVHDFLLERIFPGRGEVIGVRELHALLH